jgi:hypothetical protein
MFLRDRRRHFRKGLQAEGWIAEADGENWTPIKMMDVSKGGFAFLSPEKLDANSSRRFRVHLPGSSRLMHFSGRITYCLEHPYLQGQYRVGTEFTEIDVTDVAAIEWFVDHKEDGKP